MKQIEMLLVTNFEFEPNADELAMIRRDFPQVSLTVRDAESYGEEEIARAEIVVGSPKREDIPKAKNLRWLQTATSGIGRFADKAIYHNEEIILTNAAGAYGRQIADHVMGAIIAFNHNFLLFHDQMKTGSWEVRYPKQDLWDCTVLIFGLGDIGSHTARLAKGHGMHVIGIKRNHSEKPAYVDELATFETLDTYLPSADFVVLCAPATPETKGIMDRRRIGLMKEGSHLINVARGSLLDHDALLEALEHKKLAGAALDVTSPEPLPADHPLWQVPNVLITPHTCGFSIHDSRRTFRIFLENLGHYLGDGKMKNRVDFERKY